MSPETTPLHELVESFPGWGQAVVVVLLLAVLIIGGTLYVAHAFRAARAERWRRQSHTHDHVLRSLDRSHETHAPRELSPDDPYR